MRIFAIIPARYCSTRLPGKALADIAGKPMLQWVWEAAKLTSEIERVIIATDDERIRTSAESFGAEVIMTSPNCKSGSDRVFEAVESIPNEDRPDFVLNIQGDEPLLTPSILGDLISALRECSAPMATIITPADEHDLQTPSTVKAVVDSNSNALYFSRAGIPFVAGDYRPVFFKHIGIYAYRPDFLALFAKLPPSPLEFAEKLEQLRALENGFKIHCIEIPAAKSLIGIDTPEDLAEIRKLLANPGAVHDPSF
jgi:3-deoxy-manno-octulosonate cytidylyltransferase (CMP-KDO synthetase)